MFLTLDRVALYPQPANSPGRRTPMKAGRVSPGRAALEQEGLRDVAVAHCTCDSISLPDRGAAVHVLTS
jgi:hypothetical protein